jgi:acetamidase/formamidase
VRGAEPGDTLAIEILDIHTRGWGWTAILPGGFGLLAEDFPDAYLRVFEFTDGDVIQFAENRAHPVTPFFGTMGVCPEGASAVPVMPPGRFGGNMDSRQLTKGTTLFLPMQVPGALFSCGDAHAAQGGRRRGVRHRRRVAHVRGAAVHGAEGPLDPDRPVPGAARLADARGRPRRLVRHDGRGPDLDVGARDAVRAMVVHLNEDHGLSREDAYLLSSLCVDLKISEIVDAGQYIVSALLPQAVFTA